MDGLPVLCVLGLLCSLGLAVDKTLPPEDLDGSGDDEDFSGSGFGSVFDLESKDINVHSTSDSTLVPTVEGSTAAQEPETVDKEETKMEDTTKSAETTKTPNSIIEDLFALDTDAKEGTTQEATTSPFQQTTAGLIEEIDTKKHHHHHHHHPHHHTTTPSTSLPSASAEHNDNTTDVPPKVKPHDLPEQMTTSSPQESNMHPQELTTPVEHLAKHGVLHEETTSGSTSTSTDNEGAVEPIDADHLPGLDSFVTSTVTEDSHTHKDHHHPNHHHHHPHPHHTTPSSLDGSDVQQEVTTVASDLIEHEDNVKGEPTTTVAEDGHPHHGHPNHVHPHHTHHHETTPSTPTSTEPEKPDQVHTHEPKGRRVHVPDVKSTTAVPVINEEVSEDAENNFTSSTVVYNVSRNPFDEEASDSKEEGSTGGIADEDIYLEETAVVNKGRMMPANPSTDEGTSDAAHGIMERKELLAGIIAGGVAGLVFAGFLVAFVLYRMKKKDEGSYSLEEPKQSNGGYQKPREQREFYA